jgi:hypothetical protein
MFGFDSLVSAHGVNGNPHRVASAYSSASLITWRPL